MATKRGKTDEQREEDQELEREEEAKEAEEDSRVASSSTSSSSSSDSNGVDANQRWLLDVLEDEHLKSLAAKTVSDKHATLKEYEATFARISNRLLNEVALVINGQPHRLAEIAYYYEGGNHHDTFTHCDPLQQTTANWYFHKSGATYKGGSYKGLDITFGGQVGADGKRAFGGILIRAIEPLAGAAAAENESEDDDDDDDEAEKKKGAKKGKAKPKAATKKGKAAASGSVNFIEGPSLVVDRVLSVCGADSIIKFVASNFPEHTDSPPAHYVAGRQLYLAPISAVVSSPSVKYETVTMPNRAVRASPRVGLTLKKVREDAETFIMKAYRYFIYPELMKKGKVYMICALYFDAGMDVAEIQRVSQTGKATIDNYVRDFESGKSKKGDVTSFRNLNLNTAQLCQLYGAVSTLV